MSIHVTRAPTVPLTSYDTKRRSHLNKPFETLQNHGNDSKARKLGSVRVKAEKC